MVGTLEYAQAAAIAATAKKNMTSQSELRSGNGMSSFLQRQRQALELKKYEEAIRKSTPEYQAQQQQIAQQKQIQTTTQDVRTSLQNKINTLQSDIASLKTSEADIKRDGVSYNEVPLLENVQDKMRRQQELLDVYQGQNKLSNEQLYNKYSSGELGYEVESTITTQQRQQSLQEQRRVQAKELGVQPYQVSAELARKEQIRGKDIYAGQLIKYSEMKGGIGKLDPKLQEQFTKLEKEGVITMTPVYPNDQLYKSTKEGIVPVGKPTTTSPSYSFNLTSFSDGVYAPTRYEQGPVTKYFQEYRKNISGYIPNRSTYMDKTSTLGPAVDTTKWTTKQLTGGVNQYLPQVYVGTTAAPIPKYEIDSSTGILITPTKKDTTGFKMEYKITKGSGTTSTTAIPTFVLPQLSATKDIEGNITFTEPGKKGESIFQKVVSFPSRRLDALAYHSGRGTTMITKTLTQDIFRMKPTKTYTEIVPRTVSLLGPQQTRQDITSSFYQPQDVIKRKVVKTTFAGEAPTIAGKSAQFATYAIPETAAALVAGPMAAAGVGFALGVSGSLDAQRSVPERILWGTGAVVSGVILYRGGKQFFTGKIKETKTEILPPKRISSEKVGFIQTEKGAKPVITLEETLSQTTYKSKRVYTPYQMWKSKVFNKPIPFKTVKELKQSILIPDMIPGQEMTAGRFKTTVVESGKIKPYSSTKQKLTILEDGTIKRGPITIEGLTPAPRKTINRKLEEQLTRDLRNAAGILPTKPQLEKVVITRAGDEIQLFKSGKFKTKLVIKEVKVNPKIVELKNKQVRSVEKGASGFTYERSGLSKEFFKRIDRTPGTVYLNVDEIKLGGPTKSEVIKHELGHSTFDLLKPSKQKRILQSISGEDAIKNLANKYDSVLDIPNVYIDKGIESIKKEYTADVLFYGKSPTIKVKTKVADLTKPIQSFGKSGRVGTSVYTTRQGMKYNIGDRKLYAGDLYMKTGKKTTEYNVPFNINKLVKEAKSSQSRSFEKAIKRIEVGDIIKERVSTIDITKTAGRKTRVQVSGVKERTIDLVVKDSISGGDIIIQTPIEKQEGNLITIQLAEQKLKVSPKEVQKALKLSREVPKTTLPARTPGTKLEIISDIKPLPKVVEPYYLGGVFKESGYYTGEGTYERSTGGFVYTGKGMSKGVLTGDVITPTVSQPTININRIKPQLDITTSQGTSFNFDNNLKITPIERIDTITKQDITPIEIQIPKQDVTQKQVQRLQSAQKLDFGTRQRVIPKITTIQKPQTSKKQKPFEVTKSQRLDKLKAYTVEIKRRGKFMEVAKGLPKGLALKKGVEVTRKTLARTFRLKEAGTTSKADIGFKVPGGMFRPPKYPQGEESYVQIRALTRGTGEVPQIQAERRTKSKSRRIKFL